MSGGFDSGGKGGSDGKATKKGSGFLDGLKSFGASMLEGFLGGVAGQPATGQSGRPVVSHRDPVAERDRPLAAKQIHRSLKAWRDKEADEPASDESKAPEGDAGTAPEKDAADAAPAETTGTADAAGADDAKSAGTSDQGSADQSKPDTESKDEAAPSEEAAEVATKPISVAAKLKGVHRKIFRATPTPAQAAARKVVYGVAAKAVKSDGGVISQSTISGAQEDMLLKLRSIDQGKVEITAADILGKGNLAMANITVGGKTKGGVDVPEKMFPIGKDQLATIFSSGSANGIEVGLEVRDGAGKVLRPATGIDPAIKDFVPHYEVSASQPPKPADPTVQVADEAELKKFLESNGQLIGNRGFVPQLDKHSEQAVWQAVRLQDATIAAWIDSLGLARITSFKVHIHTERQMCGQCAAASAAMMGNLATHAPATDAALKKAAAPPPGTNVSSTVPFKGAAGPAAPGAATPATPNATPPTGKTKPTKKA